MAKVAVQCTAETFVVKIATSPSREPLYASRWHNKNQLVFSVTFYYICNMKSSSKKSKIREQILKSLVASFKIEGIEIPLSVAELALKKVELNLGK